MVKVLSSTTRRFLPFQEAREYARTLGFSGARQWIEWAGTDLRPSNIPFSPSVVYAGEFQSFPDFLGYKSRAVLRDLHGSIEPPRSFDHVETRNEGLEFFSNCVVEHAPKFEIMPFHYYSTISCLLRSGASEGDSRFASDWIPLLIRAGKISSDGSIQFRPMKHIARSYGVFSIDLSNRSIYWFPPGSVLPNCVKITSHESKYSSFRLDPRRLSEALRELEMKSIPRTPCDWLANGFLTDLDTLWGSCVRQVWRMIYHSLNLPVEFNSALIGTSHNLFLDGVPVLTKTASLHHSGKPYINMYRNRSGKTITLSHRDDFEFVVAMVHEGNGKVIGVYLFPKEILAEKKILRNAEKQQCGSSNLFFIPPIERFLNVTERVIQKHSWKNEFFIDLTEGADIVASRKRFLEIFTRYRSKTCLSSCTNRRFLPFEEARAYARTLGLKGSKEWIKWASTSDRPCNISSTPWKKYRAEFQGFPNFLGYEPKVKRGTPFVDVEPWCPAQKKKTRDEAAKRLVDLVTQHAPEFELKLFPYISTISVLVRLRHNAENDARSDDWVPLVVRSTNTNASGLSQFTKIKRASQSHAILAINLTTESLYFFPQNTNLPDTVRVSSHQTRYDSVRLEPEGLREALTKHCKESPQTAAPWEWLSHVFSKSPDALWGACVSQIWRSVYLPLGLSLEFGPSTIGNSHNLYIDGLPILQKTASYHHMGRLSINLYRRLNGKFGRIRDVDGLAFVIAMIHDGNAKVVGLYLFPKTILAEKALLSNPDKRHRGICNLYLIPPGEDHFEKEAKSVQQRHAWKNEFYIDLSEIANIDHGRQQFLEIFTYYRPKGVLN